MVEEANLLCDMRRQFVKARIVAIIPWG
jgi:hypothetical protein